MRTSPLDDIRIASPCTVSWNSMEGDDRSRFCHQCRLNVFNLSSMTREEAERLIESRQGKVCVRLYRRPDGTVLTQDCPVGLKAIRLRVAKFAAFAAGVLGMLGFGAFRWTRYLDRSTPTMGLIAMPATEMIGDAAAPSATPSAAPSYDMGKISAPGRP
ncbi:MAG: hypothetical protein HY078_11395 [Elusimicrobia bacterium]|nr:hypothetical protein [Elusimicrobiota bacterium]